MSSTLWPAPAKINLFLHVLGRRADGYHDLQTVFQFLDFADEVRLEPSVNGDVRRVKPIAGVSEEQDLTLRAARRLKELAGTAQGVEIEVTKKIPMGAGLGGGSSDCASVLVALNHLWQLDWSVDALAEVGVELGADVPVFIRGLAAWAEGRGERLAPLTLESGWYVVIVPNCQVSTGQIFQDPALTRNSRPMTMSDCLNYGSTDPHKIGPDILMRHTRNDCEALVRRQYDSVDAALKWLGNFGECRMTGTGAAIFAPVVSEETGKDWLEQLPTEWSAFVARGVNRSPLLECLAQASSEF
jgi:4-diphosphocytidyl-2-C-methyl-D-erythritol kinase